MTMKLKKFKHCIELVKAKKWTIAFAEGGSGGKICRKFAVLPDADVVVLGGIVALKDHMKEYFFGIKSDVLRKYGSESAEVACKMAQHLCEYLAADIHISVTGDFGLNDIHKREQTLQSVFIQILFPDEAVSIKTEVDKERGGWANQTADAISELITEKLSTDK